MVLGLWGFLRVLWVDRFLGFSAVRDGGKNESFRPAELHSPKASGRAEEATLRGRLDCGTRKRVPPSMWGYLWWGLIRVVQAGRAGRPAGEFPHLQGRDMGHPDWWWCGGIHGTSVAEDDGFWWWGCGEGLAVLLRVDKIRNRKQATTITKYEGPSPSASLRVGMTT